MSANNSISQLLEQFIELYNNSLSTFEKTNEAITTDKETVAIDLYDPKNGSVKTIQIPSFGFLKREIDRLSGNLDALSGNTSTTANVRLKDGSYRRVLTSKLQGPAPTITNLASPTSFKTKANENRYELQAITFQINGYSLTAGRNLNNADIASGRNVCIIGSNVAAKLFANL